MWDKAQVDGDTHMTTIRKTFTFTVDIARVQREAAASKAMTPQERCRALREKMAKATAQDFIQGRVW